jgi:hypothetical protein
MSALGASPPTEAQRRVIARLDRRVLASSKKAKHDHPMPTKDEAWQAFCKAAEDDGQAPNRDEFERWWACE